MYNQYTNYPNQMANPMGYPGPTTTYPVFVLSPEELYRLRFTPIEVNIVTFLLTNKIAITPTNIQFFFPQLSYEVIMQLAPRIRYLRDVITGKTTITTKHDKSKHYKRLFGQHYKVGIKDLPVSTLYEVPRYAVVANIKDTSYAAVNSLNYKGDAMYYKVMDVTSRVTVAYPRRLVLKYGYPKKIPNVIEVLEEKQPNGFPILAIDKDYCKVCNRYIIVASLKRPEFHLGMVEIMAIEGTLVYVYAQNMGTKPNVSYQGGTTRIYDYGYKVDEIKSKIEKVAQGVYRCVKGIDMDFEQDYEAGNCDFNLVDVVKDESMDIEE